MLDSNSKILITGGAGFIGTHLAADLLKRGYQVVILDNLSPQVHGPNPDLSHEIYKSDQLTFIKGSVLDQNLMQDCLAQVQGVVHLAAETGTAQSMYSIAHYNNVNSQGTAILLDILANSSEKKVSRLVLSSSRSIYGEGAYNCNKCGSVYPNSRGFEQLQKEQWGLICPSCGNESIAAIPTPESAEIKPASIYAATKYAQEDLVKIACESIGVTPVVLRFQNVYGAGQSLNNPYTGILSIFSTRIRRGLDLPIFEDGLESRDFIYVDDIVKAIRLSLESKSEKTATYNVGSGEPTSVLKVAQLLVKSLQGKQEPKVTGQYRLGDIRHCYADLSQIKKDLNFAPKVSLENGINKFVDWVKTQPLPEDKLDKANQELKDRGMMN